VKKLSFDDSTEVILTTPVRSNEPHDVLPRARSVSAPKILGSPLAKQQAAAASQIPPIAPVTQTESGTKNEPQSAPPETVAPATAGSQSDTDATPETGVTQTISKEEIKARIHANQSKRRELLQQLQKLDEEQHELFLLLNM
jgi:hypothetical protein